MRRIVIAGFTETGLLAQTFGGHINDWTVAISDDPKKESSRLLFFSLNAVSGNSEKPNTQFRVSLGKIERQEQKTDSFAIDIAGNVASRQGCCGGGVVAALDRLVKSPHRCRSHMPAPFAL